MSLSTRRPLSFAAGLIPALGLCLGLMLGVAHANEGPKVRKKAIAACQKKKVGDDCAFKAGDEKKHGKCRKTAHGATACIPHEMHQKWQKARNACRGKSAGDSCTWTHDGNQETGSCVDGPRGLACKPK